MEYQQTLPTDKFQHSPAESLMSIPGDSFTSLFDVTTPSATSTMNPMEMMTPKSFTEDQIPSSLPRIKQEEGVSTPSPSPGPEKKTAKKRKSWGQVLPEPKTNLPPRKRAKTEDEKEQRRVERVLRNRRAAQSSRERKRLEVEALEKRNQELEQAVMAAEQANAKLMMELEQIRRSGGVSYPPSVLDSFRVNPSLSRELFSEPIDGLVPSSTTVDPTALSPVLSPVAESAEEIAESEPSNEVKLEPTESTSPDLTQLSQVGGDAQVVPSAANLDAANLGLAPALPGDAAFSLGNSDFLPTSIDTDRYVLENGYLSSSDSSIIGDDNMVGDAPAFGLHDDFDLSLWLNEDNTIPSESMATSDFAAAIQGLEPKIYEPENQVSSENPNQQPHPGASSHGCDVGGIAVGV
ncbi:transcription factor that binds to CRE motif [Fusarium equiseti]|uniref:Transcription factor that binds to CRE motif n=1 Tax=Fusarium equiseti TaxID=61235 RepID=A0ABQ8R7D7_FUSEQ|nr:transcription factor that binds to CRE motif [Fusarium equiseti]